MLVLIQFDVCGYDWVRAFQLADKPVSAQLPADAAVADSDDAVSEWEDPVYRSVSPRSIFKAPHTAFLSFIFTPYIREIPHFQKGITYFQAKLSNLSYLIFCVLII